MSKFKVHINLHTETRKGYHKTGWVSKAETLMGARGSYSMSSSISLMTEEISNQHAHIYLQGNLVNNESSSKIKLS